MQLQHGIFQENFSGQSFQGQPRSPAAWRSWRPERCDTCPLDSLPSCWKIFRRPHPSKSFRDLRILRLPLNRRVTFILEGGVPLFEVMDSPKGTIDFLPKQLSRLGPDRPVGFLVSPLQQIKCGRLQKTWKLVCVCVCVSCWFSPSPSKWGTHKKEFLQTIRGA